MKFGLLTQYYPPEIGAPQARLSELAQHFAERGHEVHVLTAMPSYPRGKVYEGYGGVFRRERAGAISVIRTCLYPTQSAGMVPRLTSYTSFAASSAIVGAAVLPRLDYLMTESPPLFLAPTGYALSSLKRARWIFNVSDLWPASAVDLGVVREGRALRAAEALEAWSYRKAWLVTGQSREILEGIQAKVPSTQTYHLSNGVDLDRFHPTRNPAVRTEILSAFDGGASDSEPVIALYAGLHGLAQGLDQLVSAAAHLQNTGHGRKVVIACIGDGVERSALTEQAASLGLDNIRFLPALARERMPEIVASADIALVPLKHRIFGAVPSKIYEAMGVANPIVLIAEGEPARIVREAGAGEVVQPGDVVGLADALQRLSANPELRKAMGDRGRAAAMHLYNRRIIANAFIDHLESHIN